MKKTIPFIIALIAFCIVSCKTDNNNLPDGLYAEIETSKGNIIVALDYKKAPITVANFVSLAEGKNPFVSEDLKGKPFYEKLKFHRVIPNFMIQGGDPLGTGAGDAGYRFKDEFSDEKFDKGGILAMANSGPATNSSQFFITHVETPWLNGMHTIFGHVVENGMDVVNTIAQDDDLLSITIIRKGEDAKKFNAVKVFSLNKAKLGKLIDEKVALFAQHKANAIKLPSGVQYKITKKGSGKKGADGTTVMVAYAGYLENGMLFDSSDPKLVEACGKLNPQRAAQNGYQTLPYTFGKGGGLIPGLEEGLTKLGLGDKALIFIPSQLGYGENGAGADIPPNANLIFEIEFLEQ
jgi:cyclophilin family peptidyl-prolyl cis-trans isomerase